VLSKLFTVLDRLSVAFKFDPDPVSQRDTVFHIKKEFLHGKPQIAFNDNRKSSTRYDYLAQETLSSSGKGQKWTSVYLLNTVDG
jgi:hypothetical protein